MYCLLCISSYTSYKTFVRVQLDSCGRTGMYTSGSTIEVVKCCVKISFLWIFTFLKTMVFDIVSHLQGKKTAHIFLISNSLFHLSIS